MHKGGTGYGPLRELKQAGLVPEPMAIVRTPSGGAHLYYRGTEPAERPPARQAPRLPLQGGYVVASPSRIAGRTYEVVKHQPSAATFDWGAAKQLLDPAPERQPYRAPERTGDRPRDLSHLPGWVASQPEGNRNTGLFWAANRAVEAGDVATLDSLARAARAAGLDDREIGRTITSAQRTATAGDRPFEHPVLQATAQAAPQPQKTAQTELEAGR